MPLPRLVVVVGGYPLSLLLPLRPVVVVVVVGRKHQSMFLHVCACYHQGLRGAGRQGHRLDRHWDHHLGHQGRHLNRQDHCLDHQVRRGQEMNRMVVEVALVVPVVLVALRLFLAMAVAVAVYLRPQARH